MGGAHVSASSDSAFADGYAVANNPALAAEFRTLNVTASNLVYAGGVYHTFLSVAVPVKNRTTWTFSANSLNTPAQTLRTELQPEGNGQSFTANSFAAGAGYSRALSDMFSFGINLKLIREQLAEYSATAAGVDLGFLYKTDFRNLRFAAALQNFGINSTLSGSGRPVYITQDGTSAQVESFSSATLFKMGVSIDAYTNGPHLITATVQLNHPNDNAENIRLGAEYAFKKALFLRAGWRVNVDGQNIPSGGIGLRTHAGRHDLRIDYAAQPTTYLGLFHSVGISFNLVKEASAEEQHQ